MRHDAWYMIYVLWYMMNTTSHKYVYIYIYIHAWMIYDIWCTLYNMTWYDYISLLERTRRGLGEAVLDRIWDQAANCFWGQRWPISKPHMWAIAEEHWFLHGDIQIYVQLFCFKMLSSGKLTYLRKMTFLKGTLTVSKTIFSGYFDLPESKLCVSFNINVKHGCLKHFFQRISRYPMTRPGIQCKRHWEVYDCIWPVIYIIT